jgi:hypothetical protein
MFDMLRDLPRKDVMFDFKPMTVAVLLFFGVAPALLFGPGVWRWIEDQFGPSSEECRNDDGLWRKTGTRQLSSWKASICTMRFGSYGSSEG